MSKSVIIENPQRFKRMAKIHKYWSRKPWNLMKYMIEQNTEKGDLVLDPFCGSGTVGLEAILLGRNFIGYDLNPFAIFLSENTMNNNFREKELLEQLEKLDNKIRDKVLEIYRHGDEYILYSIPGSENKKDYNMVLGDADFQKTRKIHSSNLATVYGIPKGYSMNFPDAHFPESFYKDRFSYKGVKKISDLISFNNLKVLEILWNEINAMPKSLVPTFKLILSNTLLHVSKLKSENIRPLGVNNYWIPGDYIDENVYWRFLDRFKQILVAKKEINNRFKLSQEIPIGNYQLNCSTSIPLSNIAKESLDYILTDPPYGDVIQYSELSFVWNTWLQEIQKIDDELIINPVQDKDIEYFIINLDKLIHESFRVLKQNKKFTVCFQNKDPRIWFEVAISAAKAGFEICSIEAFDYLGTPFNKNWASKSPKMDLYVTFTKGKRSKENLRMLKEIELEEITESMGRTNFPDGVNEITDPYSKFIACAIMKIVAEKRIPRYTNKILNEIISELN